MTECLDDRPVVLGDLPACLGDFNCGDVGGGGGGRLSNDERSVTEVATVKCSLVLTSKSSTSSMSMRVTVMVAVGDEARDCTMCC